MRQIIITLMLLGFFISPERACAQLFLLGKWKVNIHKTLADMSVNEHLNYDQLSAAGKQRVANNLQAREYDFKNDSSVSVAWVSKNGPMISNGTWSTTTGQKFLTLSFGQTTAQYKFVIISENECVLESENEDLMFAKLYLKKSDD